MRFAVHRPGIPVASARSHRMPCGDVPSRVNVCVAGVSAGGAPEDGLALTRLRVHPPARRAALTRERGTDLLHSAGCFLLQASDQQAHPDARMPRFSPAFCRTHRPGLAAVPWADRVMFLIWRSSTLIRSNRRAMAVEVFSAQSLRRSVSRARSRAMARFTPTLRFDPRRARANLRSSRRSLRRCRPSNLGACSRSPVERAAHTATPRSIPTTWPFLGAATGAGTAAKATCQRPARSKVAR